MALKVGELFASFNLDTSGVSSAIDSAEQKMSQMGKGLAIGGAAMTAALTVPIKNAAEAIYSAGTDFSSQMSKVFAIRMLDKNSAEDLAVMDELNKKAIEMGSTTQFTASEAGEAFEYMAMAGWSVEAMLGGIEPILNLAAAAGEELGTTSDIVTDAMTAFGYTMESVGNDTGEFMNLTAHFTDVLAAASSNANTNVSMMGESFKYVGAIAGSMGYSVEDTAVMLGLLANSGIKSSQAGTTLRRIMTSLNGEIEIEGKNLKKTTIQTSNADGSMRNFSDIIADCREAFSHLTESEQAAMAKNLVGQNAMAGFLALMNASQSDVDALTEAILNCDGATEQMAKTMLDNAEGDVTLFKSALEGLEITLWNLAEGSFRDVIQKATSLVDSFRNASQETQLGTIRMAGLAAAIGPVMAGMGGLVAFLPKLAHTFTFLTGPTAMIAVSLLALGAAAIDSGNSIGHTFVKAATKAGTKVREFGKEVKGQLPQLTTNMKAFIQSLKVGFLTGIPGVIDGLSDVLTTAISAISGSMGDVSSLAQLVVTTLASSLTKNMGGLVTSAVSLLSSLATALISNIPVLYSATTKVISSLITELSKADITSVATSLIGQVGTTLATMADLMFGKNGTDGLAASAMTGAFNLATAIINAVTASLPQVEGAGKMILDKLAEVLSPTNITNFASSASTLAKNLLTAIANAISGLGTTAASILTAIGDTLFKKDANGNSIVTAGVSSLTTIVRTIFNTIRDDVIPSMGGAIGEIFHAIAGLFTKDNMVDIASGLGDLAGAIITGLADAIGAVVDALTGITDGDEIGGVIEGAQAGVQTFAERIIDALAAAIPTLVDAGGKLLGSLAKIFSLDNIANWMEGGRQVAEGILNSIVTAFNGTDDGLSPSDFSGVANSLVENLADALGNVMDFGGELLSAGAEIANTLMGSLADALVDLDESGLGGSIGTAATNLVHSLLTKITDFGNNADVQAFMTNLGRGFEGAMGFLGDITGKIIGYIFSAQGLTDILNAGVSLGKLLIQGIVNGIAGIGNFVKEMVTSVLTSWGVLSQEEVDAAREAGEELAKTTAIAYGDGLENGEGIGKGLERFMNWANFFGGQNISGLDTAAQDAATALSGVLTSALIGATSPEEYRDAILNNLFFSNDDWLMAALAQGIDLSDESLNISEILPQIGIDIEDILPNFEDLNFWGRLMEALRSDNKAEVMNLINETLLEALGVANESAEEAVEEVSNSTASYAPEVIEAMEAAGISLEETNESVKTSVDSITQAVDEGANALGEKGFAGKLRDDMGTAEEAAAEVSDAAVQQFLLTMSEENGSSIASSFLGGMISVLEDGTLVSVFEVLATNCHSAIVSIINNGVGYTIGKNFGTGLVNGIRSMIDQAIAAAKDLGNAASNALSESIQEGSPSKLTEETGENFDLGFINAIRNGVSDAGDAAMLVGQSAASSLESAVSEMSQSAANDMSIPTTGGYSSAGAQTQTDNSQIAAQYAQAIANALNGAKVTMDGVLVGELVTDTVSEEIASRASMKRNGTV